MCVYRFIIAKLSDEKAGKVRLEICVEKWLLEQMQGTARDGALQLDLTSVEVFDAKDEKAKQRIHYAVTLGGDGTILYAAK